MVFGGSEDVSGLPDSPAERETRALIMRAWATFVRNPREGLRTELGWPEYNREGTLISLQFSSPAIYSVNASFAAIASL